MDNNNTYRPMTADSMWKLPSGAYVEDVLRNAPGLARSFVIDILDPSVESSLTRMAGRKYWRRCPPGRILMRNL